VQGVLSSLDAATQLGGSGAVGAQVPLALCGGWGRVFGGMASQPRPPAHSPCFNAAPSRARRSWFRTRRVCGAFGAHTRSVVSGGEPLSTPPFFLVGVSAGGQDAGVQGDGGWQPQSSCGCLGLDLSCPRVCFILLPVTRCLSQNSRHCGSHHLKASEHTKIP